MYSTPLAIMVIILTVETQAKSLPNDFMLLGLTPTTQLINGLSCQSYRPYLGANTEYLCSKVPQLHILLHQSNVQSRQQCEFHFRDHPWSCKFSSKLTPLRRFLRQTSKEASFYTTLTSATLTWTLINACLNGQINDSRCQCSNPRNLCHNDPKIAYELSSLITDGLNVTNNLERKTLFKINQANKELGRTVVESMMQRECRCHGVSGSCEFQTCRYRPRRLNEISERIYSVMYKNARRIQSIDEIEAKEKGLVYGRRSINYCRSNKFLDYSGSSSGRECFSVEGCEQSCCQRGHRVLTEIKLVENCQCFFSWNIVNIQCRSCEKKITRMICN